MTVQPLAMVAAVERVLSAEKLRAIGKNKRVFILAIEKTLTSIVNMQIFHKQKSPSGEFPEGLCQLILSFGN